MDLPVAFSTIHPATEINILRRYVGRRACDCLELELRAASSRHLSYVRLALIERDLGRTATRRAALTTLPVSGRPNRSTRQRTFLRRSALCATFCKGGVMLHWAVVFFVIAI